MTGVVYPMWCVYCKDCGFVGSRWEKPGTAAAYIEYCPSCSYSSVTHQRVGNKNEHEAVIEGEIDYEDMLEKNTMEKYDL